MSWMRLGNTTAYQMPKLELHLSVRHMVDGSCLLLSGHQVGGTKEIQIPLEPTKIFKRLDLRTAVELQGAYQSPTRLGSILRDGLVPGGMEGKRMMNYFGVFPPWDMRNRSTRTRSPLIGEPFMLIVYVPPVELTRFGAGLSRGGDILVPLTIPPEEIREIWIARNCRSQPDERGIGRWVLTRPYKIFFETAIQ